MVRKVIVGQAMNERPEPVGLDTVDDGRQRLPVEVNFVLRYRMWSNRPVCHLSYKDDVDQLTRALPGLQFGAKLLGDGAIRGVVVDVSVIGIVGTMLSARQYATNPTAWVSHITNVAWDQVDVDMHS